MRLQAATRFLKTGHLELMKSGQLGLLVTARILGVTAYELTTERVFVDHPWSFGKIGLSKT